MSGGGLAQSKNTEESHGRSCKCCERQNFLLQYDHPEDFVTSLFQLKGHVFYIVWRVFWAVYHMSWIVVSIYVNSNKWFIYATNWSYVILTINVVMELLAVVHVHCYRTDMLAGSCNETPWYLKIVWVIRNISNCAALFVTVYYWVMIYKPSNEITPMTVDVHGLNSLYVLLNLMVSAFPIRMEHFYQTMIYGCVYLVFSVIYHVAGGTNRQGKPYVYSSLNWNKPGSTTALAAGMVLVAIPLNHALLFVVYYLRTVVFGKRQRQRERERRANRINAANTGEQFVITKY